MKSKLIAIGLITCLLCGLCACGQDGGSNMGTDKTSDTSVESGASSASSNDPNENVTKSTAYECLFENGPIPAQDTNELWGYIDQSGNWAITPAFGDARGFWNNGLALVKDADSELWGLIDAAGQYILEPTFSGVGSYVREGLLRVCVPDRGWGYIDTSGSFVIEPQFEAAGDFSEGFAAVSSQIKFTGADNQYYYQLWGYIDTSGERLTADIYTEAYDFSNGMACIKKGDVFSALYGYIDITGIEVIPACYDEATSFYAERAFIRTNDTWEMIDLSGTPLVTGWFSISTGSGSAFYWNDNIAPVALQDGSGYTYINKDGESVTGKVYAAIRPYSNGYAAAASTDGNLYGYIDLTGDWVISPQYVNAGDFTNDGLAIVVTGDFKEQIIDTSGNCLFEASLIGRLWAPERIAVSAAGVDGAVSKTGFWSISDGMVIDYIFDKADRFATDYSYAKVQYDGLWGIIDKDGNWLIPAQFLDIKGT